MRTLSLSLDFWCSRKTSLAGSWIHTIFIQASSNMRVCLNMCSCSVLFLVFCSNNIQSISGKVTTVDNFTTSWTDGPKDICVDDSNNASCLNINTNDAKKVCGATFNATVPPVGTHQFTHLGDDQECIKHQCALTRFTNHPAYRGHMFCYQTRDGPKCDCQLTVEIK